jgi:Domain of unknown function (DUF4351)
MTRFIHDKFAKDLLEELLKDYGTVEPDKRVIGEVTRIDVLFSPITPPNTNLKPLGLLGRFLEFPALIEPYRNPVTEDEATDCLSKLLLIKGELTREANRNDTTLDRSTIPKLWIITPTASLARLSGFNVVEKSDWLPGVYFLGESLRTAIVVVHRLPKTEETLWLRLMGKGAVQNQAIDELEALPSNYPYRKVVLQLVKNFYRNLDLDENKTEEDRRLVMRLQPLYQQDQELAREEGRREGEQQGEKKGEQNLIIRQLNRRFGEIDSSLTDRVRQLSVEQLEALGEALLDFSAINDFETWLNQQT